MTTKNDKTVLHRKDIMALKKDKEEEQEGLPRNKNSGTGFYKKRKRRLRHTSWMVTNWEAVLPINDTIFVCGPWFSDQPEAAAVPIIGSLYPLGSPVMLPYL